jgi:hypothetical protein
VEAISGAKNLITLRLQTQLIPTIGGFEKGPKFTLEDAREMMENSKLRVIAIANMQYKVNPACRWFDTSTDILEKGKWVLEERVALKFVVSADVAEDKWQT